MLKIHTYKLSLEWTGNTGEGTKTYTSYKRDHVIRFPGKPDIYGSADPSFRGDAARHNPEELLVASLSMCHMLSFLHVCAASGIVVTKYEDNPVGTMNQESNGLTKFTRVDLNPHVEISAGDASQLHEMHEKAHHGCFIANSVNFPVEFHIT